jgi:hypothetical protein
MNYQNLLIWSLGKESVIDECIGDTMYCLNCGWCCERLSPLTENESIPCPHLIERDGMKLCDIYEHRPKQCRDHDFPAKICPIGRDVLNLSEEDAIERIKRNDWILYARRNV